MSKSADLSYRIQDTRTRLIMSRVNELDVRIILQCLLDLRKIRLTVNRELQIDMGKSVVFADLNGSRAVSTVIYDKDLAAFRKQRIDADIDIDRA